MPERFSDHALSANSSTDARNAPLDGQAKSPSTLTTAAPSNPAAHVTSPPRGPGSGDVADRSSYDRPRLPPASNVAATSVTAPSMRIGGVSSILNPVQADELQSNRTRKASQLESPASSTQSLPPLPLGQQTTSAFDTRPQSPGPLSGRLGERPPRRILTPRSPSLHRAASLGQLNPATGTISAHTNPFPSSPRGRAYAVEPGTSSAPPLPTPPAAVRSGYGFSAPTPPTEVAHMVSAGSTRGRRLSSSASPSTSYSSHSHAGPTSPATRYDISSLPPGPSTYSTSGEYSNSTTTAPPHAYGEEPPMGIPISSSGSQNAFQLMTLDMGAGPVQFPVNVQAASKVADEKRRRNAGASARFRQRRKEKEKEATTTIARLEQDNKELTDENSYYRNENEYYINALRQLPGGERFLGRPPFPGHRRPNALPGPAQSDSEGYQEHESRSPEGGRNVRRRTSTYSLPPPPPQQPSMPPPSGVPIQPGFGRLSSHHPSSAALPSPLSREPLPPPSYFTPANVPQHAQGGGPPPVLQTLHQPGPFNPYASDRRSSGPPGQK